MRAEAAVDVDHLTGAEWQPPGGDGRDGAADVAGSPQRAIG